MASVSDIAEVRLNTAEPTGVTYDDVLVGSLIDTHGISGACSRIWDAKAASMQKMVDVTEAGSSLAMSQAFKNAQTLAKSWSDRDTAKDSAVANVTKIYKVER
jgi:hypothetical protein